jgi:hypothetical protein
VPRAGDPAQRDPAQRDPAQRDPAQRDPAQRDPACRDNLVFKYFHSDTEVGLGASHQTGWTGPIADVIRRRYGPVATIGDVIASLGAARH